MTLPRVGVVGGGSHIFAVAHAPALASLGAEVVALYDPVRANVDVVGGRFGWPVVDDVEGVLKSGADLIVICAPHPAHAELIMRFVSAGRDVLVEKPIAPRLSEIDAVEDAVSTSGRTVAVVHQHRLRDEVIAARQVIASGALGRIRRAVVVASYPKRSVYYTDTAWRGTWQGEGGGVLLNQGLHDVDLLVHLLGRPARTSARLRTVLHPIETEDTADLLLEWDDGPTASVHVTSAAVLDGNRLEVHGSNGALRLTTSGLERRDADEDFDDFAAAPGGHFDAPPARQWRRAVAAGGGTHTDVYADVFSAIADCRAPVVGVPEARTTVEVIAAAALASELR